MVVGAKVCDLTDGFLWFVCGLYVGILMSPQISLSVSYDWRPMVVKAQWVLTLFSMTSSIQRQQPHSFSAAWTELRLLGQCLNLFWSPVFRLSMAFFCSAS